MTPQTEIPVTPLPRIPGWSLAAPRPEPWQVEQQAERTMQAAKELRAVAATNAAVAFRSRDDERMAA